MLFRSVVRYTLIVNTDHGAAIENQLDIFPNPASETITISYNGQQPEKVSLFDLSGALVMEYFPAVGGNLSVMDISGVNSGFYFLKISFNNNTVTRKIVKL